MRTSIRVVVGTLMFGMFAMPAWGQQAATPDMTTLVNGYERAAHSSFVGIPTDWTSHHLIFSAPEPGSDAEDKVQQDPRYWLQQIRRARLQSDDSFATDDGLGAIPDKKKKKPKKNKKSKKPQPIAVDKDWSVSLGAGGTVGAGFFPAKYSFGTNAETCNDYVVYNTSLAGLSAVAATGTGTFANNLSVSGTTVTINGVALTGTGVGTDTFTGEPGSGTTTVVGTVTYTWTTTTCTAFTPSATTGCVVRSATTATDATNLEEAITNTCSAVTACKVMAPGNPGATAVIASGTGATTSQVVVTNTSAAALTFTGASNQTVTPASISVAVTSGTNFALNSNTSTAATNLASAINNNTGTDDVTAAANTPGAGQVTVTATTGGTAGNSITTTEGLAGFCGAVLLSPAARTGKRASSRSTTSMLVKDAEARIQRPRGLTIPAVPL